MKSESEMQDGGAVASKDLLGTFSPTCTWDDNSKVLTVILEQKQLIACLHHAPIPSDDSPEAKWGRKILEEIHQLYLHRYQKHGSCEVRITQRHYDGAPV